jgi:activating signal cointegrator complex subunit 3
LLEILAGAAEYDELPVRHNEDLLNATLADAVVKAGGFPVDARSLDDPHVKANLLFQAHWLRVPLPSSDFVTDAKGALDNAARVTQAMIDVAADAGWLAVSLRLMNLQQALMQGRRAEDPSLCVLPGISLGDARCAAAKARAAAKEKETSKKKRKDPCVLGTLPELVSLARRDVAAAKRALAASAGRAASKALDAAVAVAARLPVIDVDARVVDGELASEPASERVTVEVRLRRVPETSFSGKRKQKEATPPRAVCPLYPKIKQEGWWVVLGDREANELLALRRVAFGDETRVKLTYEDVPLFGIQNAHEKNRRRRVVAFLVSDCYVGMDQETDVVFAAESSLEEKEESFWLAADDPSEFSEDDDAFFWENEGRAAR